MTISSSFNAGVAGLSSNATRLGTISDNIANSSTYGYKRVETDFQSMVMASSGGTYSAGGVSATTERMIDEDSSISSTTNANDLAVRGRGFLPVAAASDVESADGDLQMLMTTTGSFRLDDEGYLRSTNDLILLGWPANSDGTIPTYARDASANLEPIKVNTNQFLGEPTTSMTLGVNLPATETDAGSSGAVQPLSVEYYDNMGRSESIGVDFTPTVPASGTSNEWTMVLTDSASSGAVIGEYKLTFDDSRTSGGSLASVTSMSGGTYDSTTGSMIVNVDGGPLEINIGMPFDNSGMTQLGDEFAPLSVSKDGSPVGNLTSIEVDETGMVNAYFDSGVTRTIYQVPLVDVPNANGVIAMDQQTYAPSAESGAFFLWDSGDGPTGDIAGFALEESTTDVANELTDMIQTQRAYSSNAKVIQTVDEMLQETTNIKR